MTHYNKHVLPNGLRIITVPMQDTQTITLMVLAEAGSKYESKETNGISHFLEHMCFKGTDNYNSPHVLALEFDKIGSQHNAFTGNEYTGYYAKAHQQYLPKVLDLIADMYLTPTLPEDELEKEKGVILEEINMYLDKPERIVGDVFDQLLYGEQPAGWTILGPKENIQKFTKENLLEYRNKHYVASSTVVVLAGKFDDAIRQITERFAKIPATAKPPMSITTETQYGPRVKTYFKETDQTHLILGFRSFNMYDERIWAAGLLATLLGRGTSSRLWMKMREELGICYYVGAGNSHYQDVGNFHVFAGVGNKRVDEALEGIVAELKHFLSHGLPEEELVKVKDYRIGNMFLNLETSDAFADFYGFQELNKEKILSPEECEKKIRAVTREEIMAVAKDIIKTDTANLAIVGPFKDDSVFLKHLEF
jgi:predicted Zn-dependent peptidase